MLIILFYFSVFISYAIVSIEYSANITNYLMGMLTQRSLISIAINFKPISVLNGKGC
jgi:hypothetical protein